MSAPDRDSGLGGPIDAASTLDGSAPVDAGTDAGFDAGSTPDASSPDAGVTGDGCATAATGDWLGMARREFGGSSDSAEWRADVRWNLGSTDACVDRYWPSGTLASRPIQPDEGLFEIDRNTAPATYRMVGPPSGGSPAAVWVDHEGWFDGAVIAGFAGEVENSIEGEWLFTRVGAAFTPPTVGCSEPVQERWSGEYEIGGRVATVTWTRITTEGCVDRYRAEGTVFFPDGSNLDCLVDDYEPNTSTIDPDDGELVIDRSTDPARFRVEGWSEWQGTRICTFHGGGTQTSAASISARWADSGSTFRPSGGFDGADVGVRVELEETMRWRLRRLP